jgi:hypothetical protein
MPGSPEDLFSLADALLSPDEGVRGAARQAIETWVRTASAADITRVAIAARASFRATRWSPPFDAPITVAALLSLHRNGYVREAALHLLARADDDVVVPFLLLRADDIVPSVRAFAEAAIQERLVPSHARAFARSLGVVELLRGRQRGGGGPLVRAVRDLLLQPASRDALAAASTGEDAVVRLAAFKLRVHAEPVAPVLERALADRDTRVRLWAARAAATAPSEIDRRALVARLEASRSAWTRLLGLRVRSKLDADDDRPVERALLDHHAAVRYSARTLLRARHPDRAFGEARRAALAVLERSDASTAEIIGALGALADVGLPADAPAIARFEADARARVRSEAARTLEILIH